MHSEDVELWGAARVVDQHLTGGRCNRCEADGTCRLNAWADFRLRQWETEHRRRYPQQAPGWAAVRDDRSRRPG